MELAVSKWVVKFPLQKRKPQAGLEPTQIYMMMNKNK